MLPDAIPLHGLHRALVVKLRHHGDVLLASPVFSTLAARVPGIEIDALIYADTAPMLEGHPAIAKLHLIDRSWKRQGLIAQARGEGRLLAALRARRYDLVVHLTEHRRGAWLTRLLGPRFAVAPSRPAAGKFWRGSFTHLAGRPLNARRHVVECNLDALRRLGIYPTEDDKRLLLTPGAAAEARVAALLAAPGLGAGGFVHLHPGSRWQFKCWPAARTAQLIDALHGAGHRVVMTAAPDARELELVAAILAETTAPVVNLAGVLSLKELAALTRSARLFVGVDSAPMHIAAAMGTPIVVLFGPSGDLEWGPWQTAHRVVASDRHPCRPCGLDGCGGGKVSECLTTLPVEQVLQAIGELL